MVNNTIFNVLCTSIGNLSGCLGSIVPGRLVSKAVLLFAKLHRNGPG